MRRFILIALTLGLVGTIGLPAQGLDLSLDTSASLSKAPDPSVQASQAASLSVVLPLGSKLRLTARMGVSLAYSYDGASGESSLSLPDSLAAIDIPELSLAYGAPVENEGINQLSASLGRLPFTDSTGSLFAYRVDGLILRAAYPLLTLRAVLGYTGFLPSSAPLIASAADSTYGNGDFAPPRAVAAFSLRTPRIVGHEIFVAFTAQEDLREESQLVPEYETILDPLSGGPADSSYLTAGFSGAPTAALSYSGYGAFQFGRRLSYMEDNASPSGYSYSYAVVRAWSFGAQARLSLSSALSCSVRALFGSGDPDSASAVDGNTEGEATQFVPITRGSAGLLFSPLPGNLTQVELGLNYKPFPNQRLGPLSIQLGSKTLVFVKNGIGPVSEAGILPGEGAALLGIEEDLSASLRLLSDTSLNAQAGVYLPIKGAYDESYIKTSPIQYTIRASLSLAL